MTSYELDKIYAGLDEDNSGLLSFGEFIVPSINPIEYISMREKIWDVYSEMKPDTIWDEKL